MKNKNFNFAFICLFIMLISQITKAREDSIFLTKECITENADKTIDTVKITIKDENIVTIKKNNITTNYVNLKRTVKEFYNDLTVCKTYTDKNGFIMSVYLDPDDLSVKRVQLKERFIDRNIILKP